ncbi:MAG: hypothetical protein NC112_03755 [Oxalobacter formigenes]|nr:hypothetical protein [Oxalobacter formigenes]
MRTFGIFNICALIASFIVVVISYILIPEQAWTTATIISIAVFVLAVSFLFLAPSFIRSNESNNTATFAAIGPASVIAGFMLILSTGSVVLSLTNFNKLAMALDVFTVGTFLIGLLSLRASMRVVSQVKVSAPPSLHIKWGNNIQVIRATASAKNARILDSLSEKFRYLASDIQGGTPHDHDIEQAIQALGSQLSQDPENSIENQIKQIDILLAKREVFLHSARNKA